MSKEHVKIWFQNEFYSKVIVDFPYFANVEILGKLFVLSEIADVLKKSTISGLNHQIHVDLNLVEIINDCFTKIENPIEITSQTSLDLILLLRELKHSLQVNCGFDLAAELYAAFESEVSLLSNVATDKESYLDRIAESLHLCQNLDGLSKSAYSSAEHPLSIMQNIGALVRVFIDTLPFSGFHLSSEMEAALAKYKFLYEIDDVSLVELDDISIENLSYTILD